jgi:hypothetical protein
VGHPAVGAENSASEELDPSLPCEVQVVLVGIEKHARRAAGQISLAPPAEKFGRQRVAAVDATVAGKQYGQPRVVENGPCVSSVARNGLALGGRVVHRLLR